MDNKEKILVADCWIQHFTPDSKLVRVLGSKRIPAASLFLISGLGVTTTQQAALIYYP